MTTAAALKAIVDESRRRARADLRPVFVLDHPPTEQRWPVYHTSANCPMVRAYPDDYLRVPLWVLRSDIRHCSRSGACQA